MRMNQLFVKVINHFKILQNQSKKISTMKSMKPNNHKMIIKKNRQRVRLGWVLPTLFLIFGVFQNSFSQSDEANFVINPSSVDLEQNGTVTLTVQVEMVSGSANAAEMYLNFDPSVLQVNSLTPNTSILNVGTVSAEFDNTEGTLQYGAGVFSNFPTTSFDLLEIEFQAIGDAGTSSTIDFFDPPGVPSTIIAVNGNNILGTSSGATININSSDTQPVITLQGTASVDEGGSLSIPLTISDSDGDDLTVAITSSSNEPLALESNNDPTGIQMEPYPVDASGFFSETGGTNTAGSYSSTLNFNPVFGDGGSDGDGNGVYTITVQVDDTDGNSISTTLDVTVNDVNQTISSSGATRIQSESYDNQGNSGGPTVDGIGVEEAGTGFIIGFTTEGDFAEYEIDVLQAGTYQMDFFVSRQPNGAKSMVVTTTAGTETLIVNDTGTWADFTTVSINVPFDAGPQTLRFDWNDGSGFYMNMDYFDMTFIPDVPPTVSITSPNDGDIFVQGNTVTVDVDATDDVGITQVELFNNGTNSLGTDDTVPYQFLLDLPEGAYSLTAVASDGNSDTTSDAVAITITATIDNPPTIDPIADAQILEGNTVNLQVQINDDTNTFSSIEIFDKSVLGTNNPFTPGGTVPAGEFSYTDDNNDGIYDLVWDTSTYSGSGRSFEARVTANDNVNTPVIETFSIDLAQTIDNDDILARTFSNPLPWYGPSPQAPFTVAIESTTAKNIGYIDVGEFVEYLINVPEAGVYEATFYAGKGNNGTITTTLSADGNTIGSFSATKNDWQSYETPPSPYVFDVTFDNAGIQTLRLDFSGGSGLNIRDFGFSKVSSDLPPVVSISSPTNNSFFQVGIDNVAFSATAIDDIDGDLTNSIVWSSNLDGTIGNTGGSFNTNSLSVGTHTITASATDSQIQEGTASITVTIIPVVPTCNVTYRVNAGGPLFGLSTDDFEEDQATAGSGQIGGTAAFGTPSPYYKGTTDQIFGSSAPLVSNTTGYPDQIFQTERYSGAAAPGGMLWEFPVAENGTYEVKILFNENWGGEAGDPRVFDVEIEGDLVLEDYRPSQAAGGINIALVESFNVEVSDGVLNIDFIKGTQNPAVKGFDICFVGGISNTPPEFVAFLSPGDGTVARDCEDDGELFDFGVNFDDLEQSDADLTIEWFNGNNSLGTGNPLLDQSLPVGTHEITAVANDGVGGITTSPTSMTIEVLGAPIFTVTEGTVGGNPLLNAEVNGPDVTVCWDVQNLDVGGSSGEHFHLRLDDSDNGQGGGGSVNGQTYVRIDTPTGCFTFTNVSVGPHEISLHGAETGHNQICEPTVVPFTVIDMPPMATCQDITVQLDANGEATVTAADIDNGSSDDIGITSLAIDIDTFDCNMIGENTVELTVTDTMGQTATCMATVTVEDNIAPVAACQDISVQLSMDNIVEITAADIDNGSSDNCGVDSVSLDVFSFTDANLGENTVTLTVIDVNGNPSNCMAVVTVLPREDVLPPSISCPDISPVALGVNCQVSLSDYTSLAIVNDTEDPNPVVTQNPPPGTLVSEDTLITLTATDASNNSASCAFTLQVMDAMSPSAVCQDITVELDPITGTASIAPEDIDNGSSDNCSTVTLELNQTSFDCSDIGANTVTLTVTDESGNSATCTATVTVEDTTAPTITCPSNVMRTSISAVVLTSTDIGMPTTSDNCGVASVVGTRTDINSTDLTSAPYQQGITTIQWVVTDVNGLSNFCNQTVTIASPPLTSVPNVVGQQQATAESNIVNANLVVGSVTTANDDAVPAGSVINQNPVGGSSIVEGSPVDLVISLGALCVVNIDTQPQDPVVCEGEGTSISVVASGTGTITYQWQGSGDGINFFDLANGAPSGQSSSLNLNGLGLVADGNQYRVIVTSDNGTPNNEDDDCQEISDVVTLTVNALPIVAFTAPADLFSDAGVQTGLGNGTPLQGTENGDIGIYSGPGVTDDGNGLTYSFDPAAAGVGTHTLMYTYTNGNGCTNSASDDIVVQQAIDNPPTIDCPTDILVNVDEGQCGAIVTYTAPVGSDDKAGATTLLTSGLGSGAFFPVGITTEEYTVTDSSGQEVSCSFTITVIDNETPVVTCPADITVNNDVGECGAVVNFAPTVVDNCPGAIVSADFMSGTLFPIGSTEVTVTASDASGNEASCTFTITVIDNEEPIISCPADIVVVAAQGENTAVVNFVTPSGTDNCPGTTVEQTSGPASGTSFSLGTTTVSFEVTDSAGLTSTCSFEVTVEEAPPVDSALFLVDAGAPGDPNLGIPLYDGLVINKAAIGDTEIGVVYEPDHSLVSTTFKLTGPININRSEGPIAPQSLFGDIGIDVLGEVFPVGEYTLTVTPKGMEPIVINFTIVEGPQPPTADFEGIQDNTTAFEVNFTDGSQDSDGTIVAWSWDFDDDDVEDSNVQNPTYLFPGTGNYSVKLTVTDNDGQSDSTTKSVEAFDPNINFPPEITLLGANPLEVILGQPFNDPGATVIDDNDGTFTIQGDISNLDTNTIGSYQIIYNYTDSDGAAGDEKVRLVNVVEEQPKDAVLFFVDAGPFNQGDPTLFALTDNLVIQKSTIGNSLLGIVYLPENQPSGGTQFVMSGPINNSQSEGKSFPISAFGDKGNSVNGKVFPVGDYTLLVNPSGSPSFTLNFTVIDGPPVNLPPTAIANGIADASIPFKLDFSSNGSNDPDGNIVSYAWDFGDGNSSNSANPSHTYATEGSKTVSLTVTDNEGATGSTTIIVQAINPDEIDKVVSFVLIDAVNDVPMGEIENGDFIVSGSGINISAITDPMIVGSVKLTLTGGPVSKTQTESFAPYALYGDSSGDYNEADLPPGTYTLTAVPYSESGANGDTGQSLTVTFTIGAPPAVPNSMKVSPNPTKDVVTMSFEKPVEIREFQVFDVSGRLVKTLTGTKLQNEEMYQFETYDLPVGTYYVRSLGNKGQEFREQMVIKR